jgi:hypothetical protein
MDCPRCETVGRTPGIGKHEAIGPNGIVSFVCDDCLEELDIYTYNPRLTYEDEED